jgi:hypothetical protein
MGLSVAGAKDAFAANIGRGLRELVAKRRLGVRTGEAASITEVLHLRLPASWSNPAR